MGVFAWLTRGKGKDEPPAEWWQRLARVEHDMEQLELAWEETYGKVRRVLANVARKAKLDGEGDEGGHAANGGARHGPLSPHEIGERLRAAKAKYGRS